MKIQDRSKIMKDESFKPGWRGKDPMRAVAEKTLVGEKSEMSRRDGTGKFHKLTKQQTDMYIPRKVKVKLPQLYNHGSNV